MNALALIVLLAASAPASGPSKLMVMDLAPNGASKELSAALTGMTASELQRLHVFEVGTAQTVRDVLSMQRTRELLGCTEASCGAELSNLLGAQYLVNGKVNKLTGKTATYSLELSLTDLAQAKQVAAEVESAATEADLVAVVPKLVAKLVSPLLAERTGFLVLSSAEAGATVKVDDVVKGVTPLSGRLTLSGGPHFVLVEKQGFVAQQKQVWIAPGQVTEEQLALVPSPDFVRSYEAEASRMRLFAWISSGVAVAGVAAAAGFQLQAAALFGSPTTPGSFEYQRALLGQGIELDAAGDHRAMAEALQGQINTAQAISVVGMGATLLGAGAATYFWIQGSDPNRYARYREVNVAIAPAPGGGAAFVSGSF